MLNDTEKQALDQLTAAVANVLKLPSGSVEKISIFASEGGNFERHLAEKGVILDEDSRKQLGFGVNDCLEVLSDLEG